MKRYVKKEVVKEEKVLHAINCDECQADILHSNSDSYYKVTTHHSRWGGESYNTYEYLDICSYDCLIENMGEYLKKAGHTSSYDIELVNNQF